MTKCSWLNRLTIVAVLASSVCARPLQAQPDPTRDVYGVTHQLLKIFYPSLLHQGMAFAITGDEGAPFDALPSPLQHFSVAVIAPRSARQTERRQILSGWVDYSSTGTLERWIAGDSEFLNAAQQTDLRARIARVPDGETDEVLKEAHVRFQPESARELLESIRHQIDRLEPLLGKPSVLATEFFPRGGPSWQIKVRIASPSGSIVYRFSFEPFDGRLIAIVRD